MSRTRVRPPSRAATTSSGIGRQPTALGCARANRGPQALVEHLTLAQDDRAIGNAIGERHLVRRPQDRGPARLGVKQQLDQERLRRRIETDHGLVENEELRGPDQRTRQAGLLLEAARQLGGQEAGAMREAETLQKLVDSLLDLI